MTWRSFHIDLQVDDVVLPNLQDFLGAMVKGGLARMVNIQPVDETPRGRGVLVTGTGGTPAEALEEIRKHFREAVERAQRREGA